MVQITLSNYSIPYVSLRSYTTDGATAYYIYSKKMLSIY